MAPRETVRAMARAVKLSALRTLLVLVVLAPLALAASSPLLEWRSPVYIAAGLAGVAAFSALLVQLLLGVGVLGGALPGVPPARARRLHGWLGAGLAALVAAHVAGLWITSPPDVVDALTFTSPTPFSAWGVIAMWAVLATAVLAAYRRKLRLRPAIWRAAHGALAVIIAVRTVVHALLIEGTMETTSKIMLSALVLAAAALVCRSWIRRARGWSRGR